MRSLDLANPAVVGARTLFPRSVVTPSAEQRVLVSGGLNQKLGGIVTKGEWAGFPIYALTLEERATCPRTCAHWLDCYGNAMHLARRNRHGPELLDRLTVELADLAQKHPQGFVVRLHTLGDFYSPEYVDFWAYAIDSLPALHVFGYTAHDRKSIIGAKIAAVSEKFWHRWAIRFSSSTPAPMGSTVINYMPVGPIVPEGQVCPAQTEATAACATCGLCWSPAAKDKTIVFIRHGVTNIRDDGDERAADLLAAAKALPARANGFSLNALATAAGIPYAKAKRSAWRLIKGGQMRLTSGRPTRLQVTHES